MDIMLIKAEIHNKIKCMWRSPPDTQSAKVESEVKEGRQKE